MEDSTTIFNDIKLFKNQDGFVMSSENSLLVLGDLNNSKGYDTVNKILINSVNEVEECSISHNFQYNRYYTQNSDNVIILNFANSYLNQYI